MELIKTDGRFKLNSAGFCHILKFRWNNSEDTRLFNALGNALDEMYGPMRETYTDVNGWPKSKLNENYRLEQVRKLKRRRIYLKNPSDATILLLKVKS